MPIKKRDPQSSARRRGGRGERGHGSGKQPVAVAKGHGEDKKVRVAVAVAAPTSGPTVAVAVSTSETRANGVRVAQAQTHHGADAPGSQAVAVRRRRGTKSAPRRRTPPVDRNVLRQQDSRPLRGGLTEGDNAGALTHAREAAQERRQQRMQEFTTRVTALRELLAQMKQRTEHEAIHAMRDTFDRALEQAHRSDPQNRSRDQLLTHVGTSSAKLDALELAYYHGRSIEPSEFSFTPPSGTRARRTTETIDAFSGGTRPVCCKPGRDSVRVLTPPFYGGIRVTRGFSPIPPPNPPIPRADTQHNRVIYPEGREYGPDYEVENQLYRDLHARCMNMFVLFGLWFTKNKQMIEEHKQDGHTVTLDVLIEVFFKVLRADPEATMESLKDMADTGQVIEMGERLLQQTQEESPI